MTAPVSNKEKEHLLVLESELRRTQAELARLTDEQQRVHESLRAAEEFKSRLVRERMTPTEK